MDILLLLILGLCCGAASYAIASDENKGMGLVLGLILGPIGLLVTAIALK